MQLTVFSDLGLRIIMLMASAEPGTKFTAAEVADTINASRAHVSKVVTKLAELGFIKAVKGRYGGIYFANEAQDKSIGALLRELECGEVVDCEGSACPLLASCLLRGKLAAAQEAFFAALDNMTVRDLVHPKVNGHSLLPLA